MLPLNEPMCFSRYIHWCKLDRSSYILQRLESDAFQFVGLQLYLNYWRNSHVMLEYLSSGLDFAKSIANNQLIPIPVEWATPKFRYAIPNVAETSYMILASVIDHALQPLLMQMAHDLSLNQRMPQTHKEFTERYQQTVSSVPPYIDFKWKPISPQTWALTMPSSWTCPQLPEWEQRMKEQRSDALRLPVTSHS